MPNTAWNAPIIKNNKSSLNYRSFPVSYHSVGVRYCTMQGCNLQVFPTMTRSRVTAIFVGLGCESLNVLACSLQVSSRP